MRRQRHWTYHEEKIRKAVLVRDNYECQIRGPQCLGTANSVDHIHPKALGGRGTPDNLQAACKPCNQSKGARAGGARLSRPFFSQGNTLRTALRNISPVGAWKPVVASDYSRKPVEDGDSTS